MSNIGDLKKREEMIMKWLVGKGIPNFMVSKKVSRHLPLYNDKWYDKK